MHAPLAQAVGLERLIFLDFETYYAADYTLTKLTPPEYILDDRFETIMCGVQEGTGTPYLVDGPDFQAWLRGVDASGVCIVSHNAMFDACILSYRYGFVPSRIGCTALLARATLGALLPDVKLKTVAKALKLGQKDEQALESVKGLRRDDIRRVGAYDRLAAYCLADTAKSAGIYYRLEGSLPESEWELMDMVLRCSIEPRLLVDVPRLQRNLERIKNEKDDLLAASGATLEDLMSATKFKAVLENLGVEVENKVSPTGRVIPALARTDSFMATLAEHSDARVQTLAAARLGHKSTIDETRCERLISIGNLPWSTPSSLPVPLIYAGTHTHRLSGGWKLNMQNLPKGGELRNSLCAQPGQKLIVADLSQIEARLAAYVAHEDALVRAFAAGEDVYATFASTVFGYPIDKAVHKAERFIGKTGVLGLQYGCGAHKFFNMVEKSSRAFGVDMSSVEWTEELAQDVVKTYRRTYSRQQATWYVLNDAIRQVLSSTKYAEQAFGPCVIMPGKIQLPNKLFLHYPNLIQEDGEYRFSYGRERHRLYGGALFENIIQALARIVVMDAARRLARRHLPFVMQVHDELVFSVPDWADSTDVIREEMTRPPLWAPDLPLAVEISPPVDRYGEAK